MSERPTENVPDQPANGDKDLGQGKANAVTNRNERQSKGRYANSAPDRHPMISAGLLLMRPQHRAGRIYQRKKSDLQADVSYGDPIVFKEKGTTRFMFQNVKGLTQTTGCEDYNYYLEWMSSLSVDIFGMSETNTSWQQPHLRNDFISRVRRTFRYAKTVFGFPSDEIDELSSKETFQAGGNLQVVQGRLTTTVSGQGIQDPTGLGRWCGKTFEGKAAQKLSVITAYRTCQVTISEDTLGSTYHREYSYFQDKGEKSPQPRRRFLEDLKAAIMELQGANHVILLM